MKYKFISSLIIQTAYKFYKGGINMLRLERVLHAKPPKYNLKQRLGLFWYTKSGKIYTLLIVG
jgi:hypothetical protein